MSTSIPKQHPAVVLRSQYDHLRAFLALVIAVVVALCVALVLVAVNDDTTVIKAPSASQPAVSSVANSSGVTSPGREIQLRRSATTVVLPGAARYDGGPEEGTRGPISESAPAVAPRYDGGPDEGSRGLGH